MVQSTLVPGNKARNRAQNTFVSEAATLRKRTNFFPPSFLPPSLPSSLPPFLPLSSHPFLHRALFDGQRKKLDPSFKPPRQTFVMCGFCSKSIASDSLRQGGCGTWSSTEPHDNCCQSHDNRLLLT